MGRYEAVPWHPPVLDGVPRAYRQRGRYWAYVPDTLIEHTPLTLPAPTVERVAEATAALSLASRTAGDVDLDGFTSLALRSEAVGSSVIEGIQVSARNVALADFTGHGNAAALEVARNARLLRRATLDLATSDRLELDDVVRLQSQLVPYLPGLRQEQVWIGGANPMVATYVPPTHQRVPALMTDLLAYLNDPGDAAIVAAAVVHAQFETIHPFRDGNGRIGRALTHTVLARALGSPSVVPFSRIFAQRRQNYIDGLVAWRTDGDSATDHRVRWVDAFAEAVIEGAVLAERMALALRRLEQEYRDRLRAARTRVGGRQPRRDSTLARLVDDVIAHPIDTATAAARRLAVSTVAARDALEELASAGVFSTVKIDKEKTISYLAHEVLALADLLPAAGQPDSRPRSRPWPDSTP